MTETYTWTDAHQDTVTITWDGKILEGQVYVPEGSYRPSELGLNLEGVRWLNVGYCPFREFRDWYGGSTSMAHAHTRDICVRDGWYIFSRPGVVDDLMIHEYCHILAGPAAAAEIGRGHGPSWEAQMKRFGLVPLPTMTYVYR